MAKLNLRESENKKKWCSDTIEEFVYKQVQEAWAPPVPFIMGKKYIVRTITMITIGRLIAITGNFITLDDASWIADAGKWEDCLTKPEGIKVSEKYKRPVHINVNSIVDFTEWELALPDKSIAPDKPNTFT